MGFTVKAVVCTLNCGILGLSPTYPSREEHHRFRPQWTRNTGKIHPVSYRHRTAGYSLRLIGPLKRLKFRAFSNFTLDLSNTHERPDSMASKFMRVTATSSTSFCRMAAISELTSMAERLRTGPVSSLRSLGPAFHPRLASLRPPGQ